MSIAERFAKVSAIVCACLKKTEAGALMVVPRGVSAWCGEWGSSAVVVAGGVVVAAAGGSGWIILRRRRLLLLGDDLIKTSAFAIAGGIIVVWLLAVN